MTDYENEIEQAARNMLERYGIDALKEIDLRILELESRNQLDAVKLWRDIRNRVLQIENSTAGKTQH